MKLVLSSAVREHPDDLVVRESPWGRSALWLIFAALGAGSLAAPLLAGGWFWFAPLVGAPCLCAVALSARGVLRSWRGGWWIVRARRDGLALRLRSQLNGDLPVGWANVVTIEREHIKSVRTERVAVQGASLDGGGSSVSLRVTLELDRAVPAEVLRSIERESDPKLRRRTHFHVRVAAVERSNAVSIVWSGPSLGLQPNARAALRALEKLGYPVEHEVRRVSVEWDRLSPAEREARIDELARGGDKLEAIRLWRAHHGGTLVDAKRAVESRGQRSAA
jgi:hypothetical protein